LNSVKKGDKGGVSLSQLKTEKEVGRKNTGFSNTLVREGILCTTYLSVSHRYQGRD